MEEYSWGVRQASARGRRVGERAPGGIAAEREYGGASHVVASADYERRGGWRRCESVRTRSATRERKRRGDPNDDCNGALGLHDVLDGRAALESSRTASPGVSPDRGSILQEPDSSLTTARGFTAIPGSGCFCGRKRHPPL